MKTANSQELSGPLYKIGSGLVRENLDSIPILLNGLFLGGDAIDGIEHRQDR